MKRILGIDPGLLHTGWSVIDVQGSERKYIASGVILPPTKMALAERLAFIFNGVSGLCETFQPNECSIEVIFVNKNALSPISSSSVPLIVTFCNEVQFLNDSEANVVTLAGIFTSCKSVLFIKAPE